MPTRFHHQQIWKRITASARKEVGHVAVAYVGQAGYKLLPLRRGSVLVTDFSDAAIKSGQTSPDAILGFVRRGVRVFSWEGLHAKVFCFGSKAFVGSTNVSGHSAKILQEAAVEITDTATVRSVREFVLSLTGDEIGELQAKQMQPLYRPRKIAVRKTERKSKRRPQSVIWAVPLIREDYSDEVEERDREATPKARKRLTSSKHFELDRFHWVGKRFVSQLAIHQRVLMSIKDHKSTVRLSCPGRVIYVRRFRLRRHQHALVYLELKRGVPERNLESLKKHLGKLGRRLGRLRGPTRLSNPTDIYSLSQLW